MAQQNKPQELQFNLSPEVAKGIYSNFAVISHTPHELYLDFIQIAPNMPHANVQARVIMTPENAKNLLGALADNIRKYEETFGPIVPKQPRQKNNGGHTPNPFINGGQA